MSIQLIAKFHLVFAALVLSTACQAACSPQGLRVQQLISIKENKFEVPENINIDELALAMTSCLGNANPKIRDDIAFSSLQAWMRNKKLASQTVHSLYENLTNELNSHQPDKTGFKKPFVALTLSEVARYDRLNSNLSHEEQVALVNAAVDYMNDIKDFRGFNSREGYRHAVAHTADLMLQLSLNKSIEKQQLDQMLAAISSKLIATGEHTYVYGEPGRLMAPVFYIARRELHSETEWKTWFTNIASPKPFSSWNEALTTQPGWSHRLNSETFLMMMYVNVNESDNTKLKSILLPAITDAIKSMP
ncbi:MAG: DUF2785 domain-containing protein [Arenimonas sp.]